MSVSTQDFRLRLNAVEEQLRSLGQALAAAGQQVESNQSLPPADLEGSLARVRADFAELDESLRAAAESLEIAAPPGDSSVASLDALLAAVESAGQKAARERYRALEILAAVQAIQVSSGAEIPGLRAIHEQAAGLSQEIERADWMENHSDVQALISGAHPFSWLVRMAAEPEQLADAEWEQAETIISSEFDRVVWVALARGRLILPLGEDEPEPTVIDVSPVRVQAEAEPAVEAGDPAAEGSSGPSPIAAPTHPRWGFWRHQNAPKPEISN